MTQSAWGQARVGPGGRRAGCAWGAEGAVLGEAPGPVTRCPLSGEGSTDVLMGPEGRLLLQKVDLLR